jgi:hypothetical protein
MIFISGLIHFIIILLGLFGVQPIKIRAGQIERKENPDRVLESVAKFLRLLR